METILVICCSNFAQVVEGIRNHRPVAPETLQWTVDGDLFQFTPDIWSTKIEGQASEAIEAAERGGATVTAYIRRSDMLGFIPLLDGIEAAVAHTINVGVLANCLSGVFLQ